MRTARGPLLLGHATLRPEPWGSPRPPTSSRSASPVSSPAPWPGPRSPCGPRPALVPPPLQEDERGPSALLPCHLTTLATETHILSTACRALGHWALLTPTRFSTRPHPPARAPLQGVLGQACWLPHTAPPHGRSGRGRPVPPPPGLGTGGTPSSRRTPPSAHAVPVTPPRAQIRTSGALRTRVLAVALTLVASQGHISVWHTERAPKEFSNE